MDATDNDGNTVLHYASSSNSQSMMKWLLSRPGVREKMNTKNKVSLKIAYVFFDPLCENMVTDITSHPCMMNGTWLSPFFFALFASGR